MNMFQIVSTINKKKLSIFKDVKSFENIVNYFQNNTDVIILIKYRCKFGYKMSSIIMQIAPLHRHVTIFKQKIKMQKGLSVTVNRRRTDNTIAKRKRTKVQNITQKTKDRATRTTLKKTGDELKCSGRVAVRCSICCTRCVTLINHLFQSYVHM